MQFKRKSYSPPSYASIFAGYDRQELAQSLGITKQYWCNILTGFSTPSKKLQLKIDALYQEILQAEAQVLEVHNG